MSHGDYIVEHLRPKPNGGDKREPIIGKCAAKDRDEFLIATKPPEPPPPKRELGPAATGAPDRASFKSPPKRPKFPITPFDDIKFVATEEHLVKRLLPRQGVAAIYGASQSFKTFAALDLSLHVALGWPWAGRCVEQGPAIYIAAEGARGLKKRLAGWRLQRDDNLPDKVPLGLIEVAPNLGVGVADLKELVAGIEMSGIRPSLITIDTLAQSLGAGDENGAGMVQFVANATSLANLFGCLVLIVHHVGLGDDQRLRGHSSLIGALDVSILCERKEGAYSATLAFKKVKDEECDQKFTICLARVEIALDQDGDAITTLVVESVEAGAVEDNRTPAKVPAGLLLLAAVLTQAIDEAGEFIRPYPDGPTIRAAPDAAVRGRYYTRMAEEGKPEPETQRRAYSRAIKSALDRTMVLAHLKEGRRFLWFPR